MLWASWAWSELAPWWSLTDCRPEITKENKSGVFLPSRSLSSFNCGEKKNERKLISFNCGREIKKKLTSVNWGKGKKTTKQTKKQRHSQH
jgi:hypothetical protein